MAQGVLPKAQLLEPASDTNTRGSNNAEGTETKFNTSDKGFSSSEFLNADNENKTSSDRNAELNTKSNSTVTSKEDKSPANSALDESASSVTTTTTVPEPEVVTRTSMTMTISNRTYELSDSNRKVRVVIKRRVGRRAHRNFNPPLTSV